MKSIKTIILSIGLCVFANCVSAQYHISGFISDSQTGERLIGSSVVECGTTNGTSANNNGYFSLIAKEPCIQVSFIGYKTRTLQFSADTLINLLLDGGEFLDEITVKGTLSKHFNMAKLNHKEMLSIPSIGGKPDVLKALQLMPGIQTQSEGSSLLNVRGGNPGENLYLIDNVPLIYVNHLGGFMSVFNPDMINTMDVYKGGFPAKYGGKLSSVVAITQREGDKSKLKGSLGIGVTDASFTVEGPLLKKKASYIITGRKTLTEPLFVLASGLTDSEYYILYGFHDINGKFSWHPNEKNGVYINLYQGDDYIRYWNREKKRTNEKYTLTNAWGNWMASTRWNRVVSPRLFFDQTISYTRYRLSNVSTYKTNTAADTIDLKNNYLSMVQDLSVRSDWQYKLSRNWSSYFGAKATLFMHTPNKTVHSAQNVQQTNENIASLESAIYCNNTIELFHFIDADLGLRLVNYRTGKFNHFSFEPRLFLNTQLSKDHTLNFSYQNVTQYAHLLFTQGSMMNNEVWVPADENILPANAIQYSMGWKGSFFGDVFQAEANVYFKQLNQLSTYKEGFTNLMGDGGWRSKIESGGEGIAKGVELLIRKTQGNWTGFVGYTFSKSTRRFPGINKGEEFLFDYDRPHSLSVNLNHRLSKKWEVNATLVYQTGLPYTPVVGRQITPDIYATGVDYTEAFIYGERNSERMKDYHRLDLGFTYTTKTNRGNKAVWNFSVYNAYNRHNPALYYYGYSIDGFENYNPAKYTPLKQYQTSYFPIIPTIAYKVFFEAGTSTKKKEKSSIYQKIKNYFNYAY